MNVSPQACYKLKKISMEEMCIGKTTRQPQLGKKKRKSMNEKVKWRRMHDSTGLVIPEAPESKSSSRGGDKAAVTRREKTTRWLQMIIRAEGGSLT